MSHDPDQGPIFGDGKLWVRSSKVFHWMLGTAEGWLPLEQVGRETMEFVKTYVFHDERKDFYPTAFRTFMISLATASPRPRDTQFIPLLTVHDKRSATAVAIQQKNNNISLP